MSDAFDFEDEDDLGFPSVEGRPAPPPPPSRFGVGSPMPPYDEEGANPYNALQAPQGNWLDGLNTAQRDAVDAMDGPVLVLAGAGTGKTRVLTTRLANILHTNRARPYQMLVVTFTNKAAREMKERVTKLVGPAAEAIWLGTFHALATKILRRHAELVHLESNFTILDTDDQIRLLKQILTAEHVDEKRWPARMLIHVIQRWKDKGWTPEKVPRGEAGDMANGRAIEIYRQYQERLISLNAADFGDLLLHCLNIFMQNQEILEKYQNLFQYILVDEYQDTNVSQYLWLRLLARKHHNICCVGDDDQSIYGWRGAEVGNILKFEKDFPGANVIRLERNYRSTDHILGAAAGLIRKNEGRLGKTLFTEETGGEKIAIHGIWDGEEEARVVCGEVETLQRKQYSLDEMAVLVRAGFQTREFEERLITLGIPYRIVGGARFYEREEIRDAMAYLRVVHQPNDDLALERIINKPARGIGKTTMQALHQIARIENIPLYRAAMKIIETEELKPAARRSLTAIMESFNRWSHFASGVDHLELTETILEESGYTDFWKQSKKPEAPGKLENLKEMLVAMEEFENLPEYLEHVALVMDNEERSGENDEKISLMTLHAAKGLEFDVVFLPGWEEGLFPSQRSMDENGLAGLEEERRLAYVGITRAKKILHILFAANRRIHGQWQSAILSRFVDELPQEHTDVRVDRGLYSGSGGGRAEDRAAFSFDGYGQGSSYGGGSSFDDFGTPRSGGPGWQRMQQKKQGTTAASRYAANKRGSSSAGRVSSSGPSFQVGDRVFHQKFGMGNVKSVDGDHLSIEFDHAGVKKVVATFVEQPS